MLLGFLSGSVFAQSPNFYLREPADYDKVEFYLHTADIGDPLYTKFGHTAVRMVDRSSGMDMIFNWGVFSFDPMFPFKFYKGDLYYWLDFYPFQVGLRRYQMEGRKVWQDRINLTTKQKQLLIAKINWNVRPENRQYLYEFYFDNCSTRVRDYFDEFLNGKVREAYFSDSTGENFRQTVRSHMMGAWLVQLALEVIMNDRQEVVMTKWQKMFLPWTLRENLAALPAYDDSGREISGKKLLTFDRILADFPEFKSNAPLGLQIVFWLFTALLLVSFACLQKANNKGFVRWFAFTLFLWSLMVGILGGLMFLGFTYSHLPILQHNANLWLFWVTDFWVLGMAYKGLRYGKFQWANEKFAKANLYYAYAHLLCAVLFLVMDVFGIFSQDVSMIRIYLLMPLILINVLIVGYVKNFRLKL